ncbi:hypothetical protein A6U87_14650 [Rhizobium sp. AC44/96]|nr:hypothetical protein A6U87_14650 [Rhizobium sp. AC44/96]
MPILSIFIASAAHAGFLSNYASWEKQDRYGQYMYVQGLFDAQDSNGAVGEESWVTARRQGLSTCFIEQSLTAPLLADAVTKHYQANVGDWVLPPSVVFQEVAGRVCLSYINTERAKANLAAWGQRDGAILTKSKQ